MRYPHLLYTTNRRLKDDSMHHNMRFLVHNNPHFPSIALGTPNALSNIVHRHHACNRHK